MAIKMTKGQEIGVLKRQLNKALKTNADLMNVLGENEELLSTIKGLKDRLGAVEKNASKYENLFLQVSSHCACMKKEGEKK